MVAYHAGLKDNVRADILKKWTENQIDIIIATVHIYIHTHSLSLHSH
jgi:superfamily II DNA helicase RecQ